MSMQDHQDSNWSDIQRGLMSLTSGRYVQVYILLPKGQITLSSCIVPCSLANGRRIDSIHCGFTSGVSLSCISIIESTLLCGSGEHAWISPAMKVCQW